MRPGKEKGRIRPWIVTNISPDRLNLAASYDRGRWSARVQSQFFLSRTFKGKQRDPRNDFGGYTVVDGTIAYADVSRVLAIALGVNPLSSQPWLFVSEHAALDAPGLPSQASSSFIRANALPDASAHNWIAVLRGDIDGSWRPPASSQPVILP